MHIRLLFSLIVLCLGLSAPAPRALADVGPCRACAENLPLLQQAPGADATFPAGLAS